MATISSGSVTVTIQPGEQYRVIASGEAYVDIGGGSTQSYRLINGSSEKLLGGFIVATPVTIRVISGSVEYRSEPLNANETIGGEDGALYRKNGKSIGPVIIDGQTEIGNTLTAILGDRWTCTGYQWKRNGVNIAGSTGTSYIVQDIDVGKDITVELTGLKYNAKFVGPNDTVDNARPAFMQANAVGYIGSFRSVTGHSSITMYRAAADMDSVEVTLSNAVLYESATLSEAFPSDGLNLEVQLTLYTPTWPYVETTRNFTATLSSGATSGTLTANAPGSTLEYCRFSNGDFRWIKLTSGSTAVTWDKPLSSSAASNPKTLQTSSRGQFQFNGSNIATLTGGKFTTLKSVISGLNIKADDPVYVNSYIMRQGGGSFLLPANQPANWQDNLSNGLLEAFIDSTTNYQSSRFGSAPWYAIAGGSNQFRPIALRGFNLVGNTKRPVTVIGDSIGSDPNSWVQQWLHANKVPYVNLCKAGEATASFLAGNEVRSQVLDRGMALVEMGRNAWDVTSMQNMWSYLRAQGFTRIVQVLPPPQTTSGTSDWSSEAAQNADTVTIGVNNQIIALVGQSNGPDAIIDTYTPCQGTNVQKWAAGYTGDGVHPNATGRAAIIAYMASQGYASLLGL